MIRANPHKTFTFQIVGIFLQFSSVHIFQIVGIFLQFRPIHINISLFSNRIKS